MRTPHSVIENIDDNVIGIISPSYAREMCIVPFRVSGDVVSVYCGSDLGETDIRRLEVLTGLSLEVVLVDGSQLDRLLSQYYRESGSNISLEDLTGIGAVHKLVEEAYSMGSSDIHFDIWDDHCVIRYRVDGRLLKRHTISISAFRPLMNQIKVESGLDIAEKRLPQDGRLSIDFGSDKLQIRVSIIPTRNGEKAVLRILNRSQTDVSLSGLGFKENDLKLLANSIYKPQGIIVVSGPTGSGKSTTLMSLVKERVSSDINIMTIEDPIEYEIAGITQVAVNSKIGLTFSKALRAFLRQDPDIIMVGEIRDEETAEMAIRAAMTGHLVLSTVHTNDALGIVNRFKDLGVPEYLIADTIQLLISQRLVRKLCSKCKTKDELRFVLKEINNVKPRTYKAVGCSSCFYTGYSGRTAIYELIEVDQSIRNRIRQNEPLDSNVGSIRDSALRLYLSGATCWDEIKNFI